MQGVLQLSSDHLRAVDGVGCALQLNSDKV